MKGNKNKISWEALTSCGKKRTNPSQQERHRFLLFRIPARTTRCFPNAEGFLWPFLFLPEIFPRRRETDRYAKADGWFSVKIPHAYLVFLPNTPSHECKSVCAFLWNDHSSPLPDDDTGRERSGPFKFHPIPLGHISDSRFFSVNLSLLYYIQ